MPTTDPPPDDDPGDLPLVTESARVVDVSPLDHNRTDEVARRAADLLVERDRPDLLDRDGDGPPDVDWDGVADLLDDDEGAEQLRHLRERHERPYPSLLSVSVDVDDAVEFLPGQFFALRFDDTPRAYSAANSPADGGIEFCIRRVPDGRLTADLFEHVEVGDEVTVRGPNGEFVARDPSDRDAALLATGTGVAPLRSIIRYVFQEGEDSFEGEQRDIWLFLGCSWADDLAYHDEFRKLADDHDNFHFVPTLTRESYLTDWDGETDYVQQAFVKYLADDADADLSEELAPYREESPNTDIEARIDPESLDVYACGVSAMVEQLVDAVTDVGVPDEFVSAEGYG
ncbi:FAD-binding oxidoreductase [Halorarius halobius]|uniref:FAD-binding oxidoreductase n=1 Tax=Halorarius halobius TaxID=2962671 RepID=UPI0020CE7609|nr:FAD-binding oxidoreductase [Halorarius halobius]